MGQRDMDMEYQEDFTHFNPQGRACMVNVGEKPSTRRTAVAGARVYVSRETLAFIQSGGAKKGDVLSVAQIAGIMGAKYTADLVPLCHPVPFHGADLSLTLDETRSCVDIRASVSCDGQTGVEMEALTAASVAALTVYDMCKAVQRDIVISDLRLLEKTGGVHGDFHRTEGHRTEEHRTEEHRAEGHRTEGQIPVSEKNDREESPVRPTPLAAAVITVSDRCARGMAVDTSGPALCTLLQEQGWKVVYTSVVPDEANQIRDALVYCADQRRIPLVLTTGGTGFSPRDVTPEATLSVAERQVPGLPEAMRAESMKITPRGCLSRSAAGIRGRTLMVNLPGSEKAARENWLAVAPALRHGVEILLSDGATDCGAG